MDGEGDVCAGDIRWLDVDDLLLLNRVNIRVFSRNEREGALSPHALEAVQKAPSTYSYYEQTHDLVLLAAVLYVRITNGHAFHNANKRTAFAACRVFMRLNGLSFDPPREEAVLVARGVAEHLYTIEEVAAWIATYSKPAASNDLLSEAMQKDGEWFASLAVDPVELPDD